ncbi:response regulator [Siccirubricoccus sp. KC 17139]|uniref:Response regulator n=1 Tax=Siccirubricoccus soli TaxID=2899147 RepID=A0ABT1CYU4_9PROT|nr:response regulator [Siccirubricoccus soli]MCO6414832.1 response regulator [Siccirubricoccus soli]MCP2680962.1 response regulator [Siccirubricoccus soli]
MIVEHEPLRVMVYRDWLKAEGARKIVDVSTGAEAFQITQNWKPDLILLDFQLPDTNAFELCGQWRQAGKAFKIVIASGMATNVAFGLAAAEYGVLGYLALPVGPEELYLTIQDVLLFGRCSPSDREQLVRQKAVYEQELAASYAQKLKAISDARELGTDQKSQHSSPLMKGLGRVAEEISKKVGSDFLLKLLSRLL